MGVHADVRGRLTHAKVEERSNVPPLPSQNTGWHVRWRFSLLLSQVHKEACAIPHKTTSPLATQPLFSRTAIVAVDLPVQMSVQTSPSLHRGPHPAPCRHVSSRPPLPSRSKTGVGTASRQHAPHFPRPGDHEEARCQRERDKDRGTMASACEGGAGVSE